MNSASITQILKAIHGGDRLAAEQLLPLVYEELRKLASRKMAQEVADHTLQPTALVHEAYLRLVGDAPGQNWINRGHFFAAAAEAMRRILIEEARRHASLKRGGAQIIAEISDDVVQKSGHDVESLLALDEALKRLETEDPDSFKLVMLRYFGGMTVEEAAVSLGVSTRTAKRHWAFARAWLQREIDGQC